MFRHADAWSMAKQSTLELEFERIWKWVHHGTHPYVAEHQFLEDRKFRFDFAWPNDLVAVEVEGGVYSQGRHVRGSGYTRDVEKYNLATLKGWKVLRFTGEMLKKRPLDCVAMVTTLLVTHGEQTEAK